MTKDRLIKEGETAYILLKQLEPYLERIEQKTFNGWRKTSWLNWRGRRNMHFMLRGVESLRAELKREIQSGIIAKKRGKS